MDAMKPMDLACFGALHCGTQDTPCSGKGGLRLSGQSRQYFVCVLFDAKWRDCLNIMGSHRDAIYLRCAEPRFHHDAYRLLKRSDYRYCEINDMTALEAPSEGRRSLMVPVIS